METAPTPETKSFLVGVGYFRCCFLFLFIGWFYFVPTLEGVIYKTIFGVIIAAISAPIAWSIMVTIFWAISQGVLGPTDKELYKNTNCMSRTCS